MPTTPELRLAELLAGLSLVTDLAASHPAEQALRASVLAAQLANDLGISRADASHAYYTSLLQVDGAAAGQAAAAPCRSAAWPRAPRKHGMAFQPSPSGRLLCS